MENGDVIVLRGKKWPNAFLRIDGKDITKPYGPGGGTVNCQYFNIPSEGEGWRNSVGTHEKLIVHQLDSSQPLFSFESNQFRKRYLRMVGADNAIVNLQYHNTAPENNKGCYEIFKLISNDENDFYLESYAFPGVYLCFSADQVVAPNSKGSGLIYSNNAKTSGTVLNYFDMDPVPSGDVDFNFSNLNGKQSSYNNGGYTFSSDGLFNKFGPYPGAYNDVTGVTAATTSATTYSLTRTDGSTFSISSILATAMNLSLSSFTITFRGTTLAGSPVIHTITIPTKTVNVNYDQYDFPSSFSHLTKLSWNTGKAAFARIMVSS